MLSVPDHQPHAIMAPWQATDGSPWKQILMQLLQQAKHDDIAAMIAVLIASLTYAFKGMLWNKPDPYRYKLFERPQQQSCHSGVAVQSRDVAQCFEQAQADILVLWASQSGTTERMAGRLAKELTRRVGANVLLLEICDIEPASCANIPESKLAIFMASTFGEGDPSDNMHAFWSWLHGDTGVSLANMRFLAFGLGNSNYKHYNHVIKTVVQRLQARGAQSLMATGLANDATGDTEEHFLGWRDCVFELLQAKLGYQLQASTYQPSLQIIEDNLVEPCDLHLGTPQARTSQRLTNAASKIYALPVAQSRELCSETHGRGCVHMEFDLSPHPDLKYKTGDHLAVWPVNPTSEADRIVRLLGIERKRAQRIHITSLDGTAVKVPSPTTLDALLCYYLEICAPVSREQVSGLAAYAPNTDAKDFLVTVSRDKASYAALLAHTHVNLGRLLEAACDSPGAWNRLPLSLVIEMLPPMQSRFYSISSSSVVQARQVAITAIVADTKPAFSDDRIPGLATNYLLSTDGSSHPRGLTYSPRPVATPLGSGYIHASVRRSTFKLPMVASAPVLMVGAGSGIAPFRAFVQERARLRVMGRDVGTTKLFFGCRSPLRDYFYQDEFTDLAANLGKSFSLTVAFSRPDNGERKKYVQEAIEDEAEDVCKLLLNMNAYFYICGSAAMARDVLKTMGSLIMARQNWSESQLKDFVDRQKKTKRWMQDVWG